MSLSAGWVGALAGPFIVLLISGCFAVGEHVHDSRNEAKTSVIDLSAVDSLDAQLPKIPGANPANGSFAWSGEGVTGNVSLQVRFTLQAPTECNVLHGRQNAAHTWGPSAVRIVQDANGRIAWGASSSHELQGLHALGLVETRAPERPESGIRHVESRLWGPDFLGDVAITVLVRDLVEDPDHEWNWNPSAPRAPIYLRVECGAELSGLALHGGREAILFDEQTLAGGAGWSDAVAGSASVADRLSAAFHSPSVKVFAIVAKSAPGTLTVEHPEGSDAWTFLPSEDFHRLEGSPGEYTLKLNYAGLASQSSFLGGIAGWSPVQRLDEAFRP